MVDDGRWKKAPGRDVEVFRVYLYQGFKAREYNNSGDGEESASPSPLRLYI